MYGNFDLKSIYYMKHLLFEKRDNINVSVLGILYIVLYNVHKSSKIHFIESYSMTCYLYVHKDIENWECDVEVYLRVHVNDSYWFKMQSI